MRHFTAQFVAPFLYLTGYRFDKSWRWSETGFKSWFYRHCSTVIANNTADAIYHRLEGEI